MVKRLMMGATCNFNPVLVQLFQNDTVMKVLSQSKDLHFYSHLKRIGTLLL